MEGSLAIHIQGQGSSSALGLGQDLQHVTVVLHRLKVTHGNKIPERLLAGLRVHWCHEVVDDGGRHRSGLREPAQQGLPRPLGHVHETVDLGDHFSFELPDRPEHCPVAPDLLLVGPFVGLGDPEMNGHDHALVRPSPRAQRRPCGQRTLGIHDAVSGVGEGPAQCLAQEHFMPAPIPDDASGPRCIAPGQGGGRKQVL